MIRKSTFSLKFANQEKINNLNGLMIECVKVVNEFIDVLWLNNSKKFPNLRTSTWLSVRLQQNLSKQAAEIVRSQRKRKNKTKPILTKRSINLDERFVDLWFDDNSFDLWVRLSSLGDRLILRLPSKKHQHFNQFLNDGWLIKKGCRLRQTDKGFFIDLYMSKPEPLKKTTGKPVGFDCGYKKLLVDSDGQKHDLGLESIYEKIAKKQQGSKSFKRSLIERDNLINQTINTIDFKGIKKVIVEDLKSVKTGSKGKTNKRFNNKLQRWSYLKVLNKLSLVCEEQGIDFIKVNPAYTSQTCNVCGTVNRRFRNGSEFICNVCGTSMDADHNAAINVLHRGVFSLSAVKELDGHFDAGHVC